MYIWIFIVPVLAKVLYKINDNLHFNIFGQHIELVFSLPFSWQVFFFCALCFGIANTIVAVFCPKIIKDHLSYSGFRGDGKGDDHLQEYGIEIDMFVERCGDTLTNHEKISTETLNINSEFLERYIRTNFWNIYKEANLHRKYWRRMCVIFYVLGLILFLEVLRRNVVWVISFIFNL